MELAKAWFRDGTLKAPSELVSLLDSHETLQGFEISEGIPEFSTSLPERGQGRNHDLWLLGRSGSKMVTVCIEAKVDEPFGNDTVAEYRAKAEKSGKPTRVPERIEALLRKVPNRDEWEDVGYQLLTAICGTAIQAVADNSKYGVLVIHELNRTEADQVKLEKNEADLGRCLRALAGTEVTVEAGVIWGPFEVGGAEVYVGVAQSK